MRTSKSLEQKEGSFISSFAVIIVVETWRNILLLSFPWNGLESPEYLTLARIAKESGDRAHFGPNGNPWERWNMVERAAYQMSKVCPSPALPPAIELTLGEAALLWNMVQIPTSSSLRLLWKLSTSVLRVRVLQDAQTIYRMYFIRSYSLLSH